MTVKTNETDIYSALKRAREEMGPLFKDARNDHFRNAYATLGATIETITEPLAKNGIVWVQTTTLVDGVYVLRTALVAEDGSQIESTMPIISKDDSDPQKLAAALTYAKRYSLQTLVGLAAEDDDGNLAATPAQAASVNGYANGTNGVAAPRAASGGQSKPIQASPNKPISVPQKKLIATLLSNLGAKSDQAQARMLNEMGIDSLDGFTSADASALIERLKQVPF